METLLGAMEEVSPKALKVPPTVLRDDEDIGNAYRSSGHPASDGHSLLDGPLVNLTSDPILPLVEDHL